MLVINTNPLFSQNPVINFDIKVQDASGRGLSDAKVTITQNGREVFNETSGKNGRPGNYQAEYEYNYLVTFSKEGYVTKKIEINTVDNYNVEDVESEIAVPFNIDMIAKQAGVDYSPVEDKPVGRFFIDPATGFFDVDRAYSSQRKKEVDRFFEKIEEDAKNKEKRFKELVKDGDKLERSKEYAKAIDKWKDALTLKDDDELKIKITDAQMKLDEVKAEQEIEENFQKAIKEGDALLASNKFDEAIAKYNEAQSIKPKEKLPKDKIDEANERRANLEEEKTNKEFNDLLAKADQLQKEEKYDKAIKTLEEASALKPKDKTPASKIKEISDFLADKAKNQAKFDELISNADNLFSQNEYERAKDIYEEANQLMPSEEKPKKQIEEIDRLIAEKEKAENETKNKQESYNKLIKEADKFLSSKNYDEAKKNYQEASKIFPEESYPQDKLKSIDETLASIDKTYTSLIETSDKLLNEEKYDEAIKSYQEALKLKPAESYPQDQIKKAETKKAELEAKFKDQKEKKKQYDNLILSGNKNAIAKNYTDALDDYKKASELLPDENLPKEKIKEINDLLASIDKDYNKLIAEADALLESGKLNEAITSYETALKVKNDQYPKDQIAKAKELLAKEKELALNEQEKEKKYFALVNEADQELTRQNYDAAKQKYQEALKLKKDGEEAKKQLALIEDIIKKRKEKYDKIISAADADFSSEKYQNSISQYEEALLIFPIEQYPKDQIKKAKDLMQKKKEEALSAQEKEAKYKEFINNGNLNFNSEDWVQAKDYYQKASDIKPDETYPKSQIDIINKQLEKLKAQKELALKEQEKEKKYNELIKQADSKFNSKDYEKSKELYKEASKIKNDGYIQSQIDKINAEMKLLTEREELKKQYDKIVAVADKKFQEKEYESAKDLYKRAMSFNPSDTYPPKKIAEIENILSQLAAEEKIKQQKEAEKLIAYNQFISKGNTNFGKTRYDEALKNYNEALKIKPGETYPKQRIDEINKLLEEQKKQKEKYKELSKNYFDMDAELYGEEVNMKESEIGLVLTKTSNKDEYKKYLKVKEFIDSINEVTTVRDTSTQSNQYFTFQQYEQMVEEIENQQEYDDLGRRANMESLALFKNYIATENGKQALKAYSENGEIASLIENMKEDLSQDQKEGQERIGENAAYYNDLNDKYAKNATKERIDNVNKTSEISEEITQMKESIQENQNDGQESIEQNNIRYTQLNNRYADESKDIKEKNTDKTSEISELLNEMKEIIRENDKDGQQNIEENAEVYNALLNEYAEYKTESNKEMLNKQGEISMQIDELKNTLAEEFGDGILLVQKQEDAVNEFNESRDQAKKEIQEKNIDKTGELFEQTEKIKEKLAQESKEGQESIEENTEIYKDLKDKYAEQAKDISIKNTDKTSEIASQTELMKSKISKDNESGQKSVEKYQAAYEEFSDETVDNKTRTTKEQKRKTLDAFENIEKQKEQISSENKNAEVNTIKNTVKTQAYKEQLASKKKLEAENNVDKTFLNAQDYNDVEERKTKMPAEDVPSQLALIFPQGVTQKIYQRKNEEGDVIEVTVRRIVVNGNDGDEYLQRTTKTGSVYFKNGMPIDETTYSTESGGKINE
mgnify:CR=1 FL=1